MAGAKAPAAAGATAAPENPAAAGAPAPPDIPIAYETIAEAIVARARETPAGGALEVRFALIPADLGRVRVRIETQGARVRVEIAAESEPARSALQPGLARLEARLQAEGWSRPEVRLDVATATDAGARRRDDDDGRRAASRAARAPHPAAAIAAAPPYRTAEPGTLDRLA